MNIQIKVMGYKLCWPYKSKSVNNENTIQAHKIEPVEISSYLIQQYK